MEKTDNGEWTRLCWENIWKTPNAHGKYEIRDSQQNLVSSGQGSIKEVLSEYLLKYAADELFFKYDIPEGEVDLDKLGHWIYPKGEEEKEIKEWAESLRGFLSEEAIEEFKKLCRMDFEKRRKTK
ncbi:MAG: hypothetical protein V3W19_00480 [Desulfatiglandales bacterium]